MATKNIVPNADGEGQLGTSSKSWAQGHIDSITGTIATPAQGSITSLGTLTGLTLSGNLVIPNDGTIGSVGTSGALTISSGGDATFSKSVTADQGIFNATANTYAGGSLILKDLNGANPMYLTSVVGNLAISNGGANDHLTITSGGNLGVGVSPENSTGTWRNLQFGGGNIVFRSSGNNGAFFGTNYLFKTNNSEVYKDSAATSRIYFDGDVVKIQQSGSGIAGDSIVYTNPLTISSGGNVGIGTDSPNYKLEVESTSDVDLFSIKSTASSNNTQLRLGISGNDSVISGTGGSTGNLVFKTYGSERMRISSGGNVGIGTNSPSAKTQIVSSSGTDGLRLNAGTSASNFAIIANNEADSATLFYVKGDGSAFISNGIKFGGTPSPAYHSGADTLDAYEEGTFTVAALASSTNPTLSVSNTTGYYTRVGNVVTVQYYSGTISVTSAGSGAVYFAGLPYQSKNTVYHTLAITHSSNFSSTTSSGFVGVGQSDFYPIQLGSTNYVNWQTGNTFIMFGGSYLI